MFRQVEISQEGGISVARGSFDGSGSVDGASEAMRNCAVAVEDANGCVGVAHVADGTSGGRWRCVWSGCYRGCRW